MAVKLKRRNLDLVCISRLQMVVLKLFILFLKQESGLNGSRLEGLVTLQNMKKAFRIMSPPTSNLKERFNFCHI